MSFKAVCWTVLVVVALGGTLLLNHWASYQPMSTLVYTGIVVTVCGFANVAVPFRFLGIRRRAVGGLVAVGGLIVAVAALSWPAPTVRVAQHKTMLDDAMPEYQFNERHSQRIHASPEQAMQATRESTFGDMKSLGTLMRVRATALRVHDTGNSLQDKRILDAFAASGFLRAGSEHEIVMFGGANVVAQRPLEVHSLQEFADFREQGAVKMAYDIRVEDAGGGWCMISTETRVMATDDSTRRGMGRYWRLIVPGSGLLRRQWLEGIRRRAEIAGES